MGALAVPRDAAQRLMHVAWPAFLMAGLAELVFFSIFDPFELHFFGQPLDWSREAIYALGFFGFWGLGVAAATLALMLAGGESEAKHLPPDEDLV